jgi:hypothetical protein
MISGLKIDRFGGYVDRVEMILFELNNSDGLGNVDMVQRGQNMITFADWMDLPGINEFTVSNS